LAKVAFGAQDLGNELYFGPVAKASLKRVEQPITAVAGNHVYVEVELRLVGLTAVVVQNVDTNRVQAVALNVGHPARRLHDVGGIVVVQIPDIDNVTAWYHQTMPVCHGQQVHERNGVIVLVDDLGRRCASNYRAKCAVVHELANVAA